MTDFINEKELYELVRQGEGASREEILEIIEKSKECRGLSFLEVSKLLSVEDDELLQHLFDAAKFIKNKIYGKRVVLFAPLYSSNECTNNCLYCGFRHSNEKLHRRTLNDDEIISEAKAIEAQGHKRLLLICGEDPKITNIDHLTHAMDLIYENTGIRRINVEAAPMSVEDYKKLKEHGLGTYVIFQETYDREVYKKMHPTGIKSRYDYRLLANDRAFEAGIDDVGLGILFGLNDYKFEVLALLKHVEHLENRFGVGPHTISVPRLRPALGWALKEVPHKVSDMDFKKIVAIFRLSVPYTGIILSTRESDALRDELLELGVSQISAGSKTNPGGYEGNDNDADQFKISDERTLNQMIKVICDRGYIPSFCTACYRRKRTGENFMSYAKTGEIHEFCQPNAILTFKESVLDYGDDEIKERAKKIIDEALLEIEDKEIRGATIAKLAQMDEGKRDLFF